jgi:hypothetical protein
MKIPAFQRYSFVAKNFSAVSKLGFSVKVFTLHISADFSSEN